MWSEHAPAAGRQRRGRLVVISGPSGTGKTSICQGLLRRLPDAVWSVSATTRERRRGEVDGQSYRFYSRQGFERRRDAGEFLEWAQYLGQYYGTPLAPVQEAIARGRTVIMEIEVQGGAQVARRMPESLRVFVLPPTMETLQSRLRGRSTESQEHLRRRLAEADGEIAFARDSGTYTHFVTNDILADTIAEIAALVEEESKDR